VLPAAPRQAQRHEDEQQGKGVSERLLILAPLAGWRPVAGKEHRGRRERACCWKAVADLYFPEAEKMVAVMDNGNPPGAASVDEAFPPQEAGRLRSRFAFQHTPKQGSWLNLAETERSLRPRQGLNRRIGAQPRLLEEEAAWERQRNTTATKVDWRFTTDNARTKLKRLYPTFKNGWTTSVLS
jgi:hypothetical protein